MSIPYWNMGDPWNTVVAIDEFGPGTLNGTPPASSNDACGPATIENSAANYEHRLPAYTNIGSIRAEMIAHGDWTEPADVNNPRTGGCTLQNIVDEIPRRHYAVGPYLPYQDAVLTDAVLRLILANHNQAIIFIVTNAAALVGNEHGVQNHFVVVAGYGGDKTDGTTGSLYILNSDVAGQHGVASGQWTTAAQFLSADPHGYAVMKPPDPPAPDPIAEAEKNIQQAIALLNSALAALGSVPHA